MFRDTSLRAKMRENPDVLSELNFSLVTRYVSEPVLTNPFSRQVLSVISEAFRLDYEYDFFETFRLDYEYEFDYDYDFLETFRFHYVQV